MNARRQKVYDKLSGHCAYCGCILPIKGWHIDHIAPMYRNYKNKPPTAGYDELDNMFPSCARCNRWKKTFTIEQFREEIMSQPERLRRDSAPFRLAEDYGIVLCRDEMDRVSFYFERVEVTDG